MKTHILKLAACAGFVAAIYVGGTAGCDDHDHDDGDHSHTDAGGHVSPYPDCQAIIDKCHPLDVGEETAIHRCHDLAHDAKNNETCTAQKDACILGICVIEAGVPDSGGGGGDDAGGDDAGNDAGDGG
jgi:hypothetical protein